MQICISANKEKKNRNIFLQNKLLCGEWYIFKQLNLVQQTITSKLKLITRDNNDTRVWP